MRILLITIYLYKLQEGETPIHYAGELTKKHAHHEFEDTDMMKLLLLYDGDVNLQTKLVSAMRSPNT